VASKTLPQPPDIWTKGHCLRSPSPLRQSHWYLHKSAWKPFSMEISRRCRLSVALPHNPDSQHPSISDATPDTPQHPSPGLRPPSPLAREGRGQGEGAEVALECSHLCRYQCARARGEGGRRPGEGQRR
jgi:hypothetical protein